MGLVVANNSVSLDGYSAGPDDGPEHPLGIGGEALFKWYESGDTEMPLPGTDMVFRVSAASADLLKREWSRIGAMVAGRRMFDIAGAWGGSPPGGGPCFIVTHHPPAEWTKDGSPFVFVTDGVESAIRQARQQAGDRTVAVSSASIMQQCLKAGLLDEIAIDLAPVVLGGGVSWFGPDTTANLAIVDVLATPHVTHLRYRVIH